MAGFMNGLTKHGIESNYARTLSHRKTFDSIAAHSGGTYQHWSKINAKQLILIAPPWHSLGRFTNGELLRRARLRRREASGRRITLQTLRFLASIRSTLRHRKAVREIDLLRELTQWLAHDISRHVKIYIYEGDMWTDRDIVEACSILPRTKVKVLKGDHDDIRRKPAALVNILSSEIEA